MKEAPVSDKQQIIDKIKSSANILITVSRDPSVDDLSAALGLTVMLNKIGKHATAVFSGAIPSAINFLEPDKVFENTIDSLRDFIIALDKEKADHLRYKVEGDVVKIFITPYRTVISEKDLEFSQGDYNVELVLALGVENKEHLDAAIEAHGQILQDVTVISFSAGNQISKIGAMDWYEQNASSLSEMVTALAGELQAGEPLLDKQISTALLTGIVAATDRFSNDKTSPAVMSFAAQLMAAGADQQLIAAKLQEFHQINNLAINPSEVSADLTSTLPAQDLTISHEPSGVEEPAAVTVLEAPETALPPVVVDEKLAENPQISSTLPPSDNEPNIVLDSGQSPLAENSLVDTGSSTVPDAEFSQSTLADSDETSGSIEDAGLTHSKVVSPTDAVQTEGHKLIDILDNENETAGFTSTLSPLDESLSTIEPNPSLGAPIKSVIPAPADNQPIPAPVVDLPLPPPVPDFSSMPALPPIPVAEQPTPVVNAPTAPDIPALTNNDPSKFQIPGQ